MPHVNETESLVRLLLLGFSRLFSGACSTNNEKVSTEASLSNLHVYHVVRRNVWLVEPAFLQSRALQTT